MIHKVTNDEVENIKKTTVATAMLQQKLEERIVENAPKEEVDRIKSDIAQLQQLKSSYVSQIASKHAVLKKGDLVGIYAYARRRLSGRRAKSKRLVGKGRVWEFRFFEKKGYVTYGVHIIDGQDFDPENHYLKKI